MSERHPEETGAAVGGAGELLARRLEHCGLADADVMSAVRALPCTIRNTARETMVLDLGALTTDLYVVVRGVAARAKTDVHGHRQIVSVLVPGDCFDWPSFRLTRLSQQQMPLDHSIWALKECSIATIRGSAFNRLLGERPCLAAALDVHDIIEQDISREWLVNLGSRSAAQRVAHLLCELFFRLKAVGLTNGASCHLPITQIHLSDALGLSIVHINRVLQRMRAEGLLAFSSRTLTFLDARRLEAFAEFTPGYLLHGGRGR